MTLALLFRFLGCADTALCKAAFGSYGRERVRTVGGKKSAANVCSSMLLIRRTLESSEVRITQQSVGSL